MKRLILLKLLSKFKMLSSQTKRKIFIALGLVSVISVFFMALFAYFAFSFGSKIINQVQQAGVTQSIEQQSQGAWAQFNKSKNDPECRKQIDELFMLSTWVNFQPLSRWDSFNKHCLQTVAATENSYKTTTDY